MNRRFRQNGVSLRRVALVLGALLALISVTALGPAYADVTPVCEGQLLPKRSIFSAALDAGVVRIEELQNWAQTGNPLILERIPLNPEQLLVAQALAKFTRQTPSERRTAVLAEIQELKRQRGADQNRAAEAREETAKLVKPHLLQSIELPGSHIQGVAGIVDAQGQGWVLAEVYSNIKTQFHLYRVGEKEPVRIFKFTPAALDKIPRNHDYMAKHFLQLRLDAKGQVEVHILHKTGPTMGRFVASAKSRSLKLLHARSSTNTFFSLRSWLSLPDGQEIIVGQDTHPTVGGGMGVLSLNGEMQTYLARDADSAFWWTSSRGHFSFLGRRMDENEFRTWEWNEELHHSDPIGNFLPLAQDGRIIMFLEQNPNRVSWMDVELGPSSKKTVELGDTVLNNIVPPRFFTNYKGERLAVFVKNNLEMINLTNPSRTTRPLSEDNFAGGRNASINQAFEYRGRPFLAAMETRFVGNNVEDAVVFHALDGQEIVGQIPVARDMEHFAWLNSKSNRYLAIVRKEGLDIFDVLSK